VCLQAVAVVKELQQRPAFKGLPLYALGASSGGAFVLTLTNYLRLKGEDGGSGLALQGYAVSTPNLPHSLRVDACAAACNL
jgi:hypothetical protein